MENTKLQENMKREELYASIGLNAVKTYLKEKVGLSDKDVDFLISLDVNNNLEETLDNLTFEQVKQLDGLVINYPVTSNFVFKDVIDLMSVCLGCTGIRFALQQEYTLDESRELGNVFLILDEFVKIDGEHKFYSFLDDQIFCTHELERNLKNFLDTRDEKFLSKYFKESFSLIMKNHKSYRFFDNMKWYTLDLEEFNNTGGFEGIKERAIQEYLEREMNNFNENTANADKSLTFDDAKKFSSFKITEPQEGWLEKLDHLLDESLEEGFSELPDHNEMLLMGLQFGNFKSELFVRVYSDGINCELCLYEGEFNSWNFVTSHHFDVNSTKLYQDLIKYKNTHNIESIEKYLVKMFGFIIAEEGFLLDANNKEVSANSQSYGKGDKKTNFSKLKLEKEKLYLKKSINLSDENVDYLESINPGKGLKFTLDNLTFEQAKNLTDCFKVFTIDKAKLEEFNQFVEDFEDNIGQSTSIASLELGNISIVLLTTTESDDIVSEFCLYRKLKISDNWLAPNGEQWEYIDSLDEYVNSTKLYKDLLKYKETQDIKHLEYYFRKMFELIMSDEELKSTWYVVDADSAKGFDSMNKELNNDMLKEISKIDKPSFFSLDRIVKSLLAEAKQESSESCFIMGLSCGNYSVKLQVGCYEGDASAEYVIYRMKNLNETFDTVPYLENVDDIKWIHVHNTGIFEDLSDLYENILTYLELNNPMFSYVDSWKNKMIDILSKYLTDNNLM